MNSISKIIKTLSKITIFCLISSNFYVLSSQIKVDELKPGLDYLEKKDKEFYILGPGDVLEVIISQEIPELNKTVTINGKGEINVQKLNNIYVEGLTLEELTNLMKLKYKDILINPNIVINIKLYRTINFQLLGEVELPGLYKVPGSSNNNFLADKFNQIEDLENSNFRITESNQDEKKEFQERIDSINSRNLIYNAYFPTVFDAIKKGGGITGYSDLTKVEIIRKNSISNGGGLIRTKVNLLSMLENGDTTQNIRIYDGDVIKIPKSSLLLPEQLSKAVRSNINPRLISVFVIGKVENPGEIIVSRSTSLNEAIIIAGGPKAIRGPIQFIRYNSDGSIDQRKLRYKKNSPRGTKNNPLLRTGDIISINKNIINITTEVLGEITQPFIGVFAGKEVLEDLFN